MGNNIMAKLYKEIDKTILEAIPNPSKEAYEIKIKIPEFTFLGVKNQPDFATVYITMYPGKKIIELKSLKHYAFHIILSSQKEFLENASTYLQHLEQ